MGTKDTGWYFDLVCARNKEEFAYYIVLKKIDDSDCAFLQVSLMSFPG